MNDSKKPDNFDRKKLSDDELEDVAGGAYSHTNSRGNTFSSSSKGSKDTKETKESTPDAHHHNES